MTITGSVVTSSISEDEDEVFNDVEDEATGDGDIVKVQHCLRRVYYDVLG